MKRRVGKKKSKLINELESLGIDISNIKYSCEEDKLPTKRIAFGMLRHFAKNKGYKNGWAMAQFRNIYSEWPVRKWNADPMIVPNTALKEYVYASARAYAEASK